MKSIGRSITLCCLAAILLLVAACSGTGTPAPEPSSGSNSTNESKQDQGSQQSDQSAEKPGPFTKYDPPITVTTVRGISNKQYFDPGETIDNNAIYDYYKERLGIEIKNDWTVTDYDQKIKISIASNNLPDFYNVKATDLQQLIDSDMIMDITELWEQYASEDTKNEMTKDGGMQMKTATFNDKLMAIPQTNSPYSGANFIYVRTDWLKEMNLPEPKTMQDVLTIAEAFSKRNADGKKTYGLAIDKDLNMLTGFLNGFHAHTKIWKKDESGNLVYGSIQPEVKAALKQLQDMFKAGQIDPEFAVKNGSKVAEMYGSEQLGLVYGAFWYTLSIQKPLVKDGKMTAEWKSYQIASIDDKPAQNQATYRVPSYYVINKNAKHPEAAIKLLNVWMENQIKPDESNSILVFGKDRKNKGEFFYTLNPIMANLQDYHIITGELLPKALKNNDPSILGSSMDRIARYEGAQAYLNGDGNMWYQWMVAKEGGTMAHLKEAYENNLYVFDEFVGAPTPTMSERMALLQTKENETFTKIILGGLPIEAFDTFVEEWRSLGGDKITEEVNEWYKSRK
ncbi:extracellular solute-binding protein [Paenibacillus sp. J5C_2022]|uniref:extracellular solute-binding protein n=1 Tax=Paenibacillus sp. J5C2022 TaxID=2977129 RepID=UPI0021CF710D|nr:extracellular solute-binding protein [Paenibacillus sp. J5C2022]MCU6712051.1 extracellular solute-binding protein [Paenibacillus sp. J5C2022]